MKARSVLICYCLTWVWLAVLTALLFLAPLLMNGYMLWRALPETVYRVVLIAFYLCCVPAYAALLCLLRILRSIGRKEIFSLQNIRRLKLVSWCCAAVAVLTFAAGFWYFPLIFLTAAMLFIFLIVRVVCACFLVAAAINEENSLTI